MIYCPGISSGFEKEKSEKIVKEELKLLKNEVDRLVHWDKKQVSEYNSISLFKKSECNSDYIELQRIVNKILGENDF